MTVIAIEDCNRTLAYPLFGGHFEGLLGGLLATYLLGPNYIRKHVVSPFAGDNSCYDHLPPLTEVLVDPIGLVKERLERLILPNSVACKNITSLQADVMRQARLLHGAGAEAMVCSNSKGKAGHELWTSVGLLNLFLSLEGMKPLKDRLVVITADGRLQRHTSLPRLD